MLGSNARRRWILTLSVLVAMGMVLPTVSCSSLVCLLTPRWRDWDYVQNHMGGLTLGAPQRDGERVTVPVELGLEGYSNQDSAHLASGLRVQREGKKIQVTLWTCLGQSSYPFELSFPKLEPGTYEVGYLDPSGTLHDIGRLRL